MNDCPRPRTWPATALASASHQDDTMNEATGGGRRRGLGRARPRRAGVLAVAAGLVLLTAACAGSPSSPGSRASTGTGGALSAYVSDALAFARCVRAHGIPHFPDPDSSGHFSKEAMRRLGFSVAQFRAAQSHCPQLPAAGQPPLTAQVQQDYLRAAACMRSHGIANFPDPSFSGGGVHFVRPPGIDASSERFIRARQICVRLIPAGLPYSGSDG